MADVKLFLSCVSDEFGAYRESLRHALTRPNVEIKIQEDFKSLGGDTLAGPSTTSRRFGCAAGRTSRSSRGSGSSGKISPPTTPRMWRSPKRSTRPFSPATGASPPLRDMARELSWREGRRRIDPA